MVDIRSKEYREFYDISYLKEDITPDFLDKLLKTYYKSNIYDVNYGRYYLSILISCVNSVNFSKLYFDEVNNKFENTEPIFNKILNLKKEHKDLYNFTSGLEYVYFTLINKVYNDIGEANGTTKNFLKIVMFNNKYLRIYRNKISRISKALVEIKVKNLMLQDFGKIVEDQEY